MRNLNRILTIAALCASSLWASARTEHLLPTPKQLTFVEGRGFATGKAVRIEAAEEWTTNPVVQDFLEAGRFTAAKDAQQAIAISLTDSIAGSFNHRIAGYEDESYTLRVEPETIRIVTASRTGVIRAFQTLLQLVEGDDGPIEEIEAVEITDWPSFKVRGYMHDVGRSFIDIGELKKEIALLSRFKVNTFHWHFTENQAWRFEVKAYPQLTEAQNMSRFGGKHYTQEECRDLEEFAYQRGVTVIPEIDMPGHSAAFDRAMGHAMQTDSGVTELKTILKEVAETFVRAPYVHIGADETKVTYPNFIETMAEELHRMGKKVVAWNPASNVTLSRDKGIDMAQMWSSRAKPIGEMPNIDCRYNYANHFDVFADLAGIYKSNIHHQSQGTDEIAGTIVALWNDRKLPSQEDIIVQNNLYANAVACAERGWKGGGERYIEDGGATLATEGAEFEEFSDWERRFLFHKSRLLRNEPIPYVGQTQVRWRISEAFPNGGDAEAVFPPETCEGERLPHEFSFNDSLYHSMEARGAGVYLRHTWGKIVPGMYDDPKLNHTAYAWTYVHSPKAQKAGALIEFQNYGRSERDLAPEDGKWDRKGSRIWINGEEVEGPRWDNAGKHIGNDAAGFEAELLNENFAARQPTAIELREGWNKVLIKLPYVEAPGVRLNKWMFTFVITDEAGKNALEGLIYSPD